MHSQCRLALVLAARPPLPCIRCSLRRWDAERLCPPQTPQSSSLWMRSQKLAARSTGVSSLWRRVPSRLSGASALQTGCAARRFTLSSGLSHAFSVRPSQSPPSLPERGQPRPSQVVVCHNHMQSATEFENALAHELVRRLKLGTPPNPTPRSMMWFRPRSRLRILVSAPDPRVRSLSCEGLQLGKLQAPRLQ